MSCKLSLVILLAAVFLATGCSDQADPTQPIDSGHQISAIIHGEVSDRLIDFEFAAKVGEGIDDQAALMVRGRNLAYDAELGAVTVDLSVYNDSETAYPEQVGLTFIQFMPADVTILNPDNDQNGAGALVNFEFEDDDGNWSPGEESLPRMVQFQIASGTSFGFVARIDVGLGPQGGTIGGMVWHDENENGEIDTDEMGVGGVSMALYTGDDISINPLTTVITAEDGTYHFDGQEAGYYTVVRMPLEGLEGTTPPEMAVILVEMDGVVSDFLLANFGVKRADDPDEDFVQVGDYVDAKGEYQPDPDRLVSRKFKVKRCENDKDHGGGGDCRENDCWGRLTGKLTGINFGEGYIEVMGTKVYCHDKGGKDRENFVCGLRVKVDVSRDEDVLGGEVVACRWPHLHNGRDDKVKGFVQEVIRDDEDNITGVIVLNTLVTVPPQDNKSNTPGFTGSAGNSEGQIEFR